MIHYLKGALILVCLCLIGCDEASLMKKNAPLQDEPVTRRYLDLLLERKIDQIEADLDFSHIVDLHPHESMTNLIKELPGEPPRSIKVVGGPQSFWTGFVGIRYHL